MRLRKVKNADQMIGEHPGLMITEPELHFGKWQDEFGNPNPIQIEIGTGKGQFIVEMATRYPNINFIGIEKFASVMVRAMQKGLAANLPNLKLILADAESIETMFAPREINRIFLNFSDPWPKNRHAKRRLTHPLFLEKYRILLAQGGEIRYKTDNYPFYADSLIWFVESGLAIEQMSLDLHSELEIDNVMTEFETKFVADGLPIYYIRATFREE